MRALTLTQPWATLVAIGAKRIETRGWGTGYRGPLAIHAAKGLGPVGGFLGFKDLCQSEPFRSVLKKSGVWPSDTDMPPLPMGRIIAVCELKAIARIDYYQPHPDDIAALDWEGPFLNFGSRGESLPAEPELSFGDYTPGRYAWVLENIRALPKPIPAKGALGLWEWEGQL